MRKATHKVKLTSHGLEYAKWRYKHGTWVKVIKADNQPDKDCFWLWNNAINHADNIGVLIEPYDYTEIKEI